MSADVKVYTTTYCPYCTQAKMLLRKRGISFEEIDVTERPDLREWLIKTSGLRTVPQIFINGQPVGGSDDLHALDGKGVLKRLVEEKD